MRVVVITHPSELKNEAELISAVLEAGVKRVHIRKPNWDREQTARLIESIPLPLRSRLTLHDHFELINELGVGGAQCNGRNPNLPTDLKGLKSRSCHSLEEAQRATAEFDYVTLSPIYNSISKDNYPSNFTAEELERGGLNPRIYAMGGVTPDRIPHLHSLGFGGVALLGYVWSDDTLEGVRSRVQKSVKMARMCESFSLQYITHRNDKTSDIEGAEATLKGGCRWVQLRMKGFSDEAFLEQAKQLKSICDDKRATFLLNDRVELVKACGADGVHIGKGDMSPLEARKILGESAIIGGTANSCADIDHLVNQGIDYIGLGPFRFTTTKEKLSPTLGLEGYKNAIEHCRTMGYTTPIVAIGGITSEDIASIMECGVNGIALSGEILNAEDSVNTTQNIVKILKK